MFGRFNPRPRTEGDLEDCVGDYSQFQSTPPHGGRLDTALFCFTQKPFQSTPPHGGRRWQMPAIKRRGTFQSTPPHGGRRQVTVAKTMDVSVSIHAPARRATPSSMWQRLLPSGFNPRPRTEGDRLSGTHGGHGLCFNPRPRTEGDDRELLGRHWQARFNPRPRTEGDMLSP